VHSKEYNEAIKDIFFELSLKRRLMDHLEDKLNIAGWYERRKSFVCPPCSVNAYSRVGSQRIASPHPALYGQLKELRDSICDERSQPIYMVAGSKALLEMTTYLPQTPGELEQIAGFGKIKIEKYGDRFLELIREYSEEHNLQSSIGNKMPGSQPRDRVGKKDRGNDTRSKTFTLYKDGKSIAEIASIRQLAIGTIEGHLTHYI
jgi:ribonuclease D